LSRMTISPDFRVGHKNCSTQARNISPSIGPSVDHGGGEPRVA
jgi:hypothetical protein